MPEIFNTPLYRPSNFSKKSLSLLSLLETFLLAIKLLKNLILSSKVFWLFFISTSLKSCFFIDFLFILFSFNFFSFKSSKSNAEVIVSLKSTRSNAVIAVQPEEIFFNLALIKSYSSDL